MPLRLAISHTKCGEKCGVKRLAMGKLTATKIKNLAQAGRYSDGDGLFLDLTGPGRAQLPSRFAAHDGVSATA